MHAAVTIGSMVAIFAAHVVLIVETHRSGGRAPRQPETRDHNEAAKRG